VLQIIDIIYHIRYSILGDFNTDPRKTLRRTNMHEWKAGDTAEITDLASKYFGQTGVVIKHGVKGGLYIKHSDGETVHHPWGYDIVRTYLQQPASKITPT
jgi:hypothetical protein